MSFPSHLGCPISLCLMRYPMRAPDENVYDRESLRKALRVKSVSPLTRAPMKWHDCYHDRFAQEAVDNYLKANPEKASERSILSWNQVLKGEFDEYDEFSLGDYPMEDWREVILEDYRLLQRMKIKDYNAYMKRSRWTLLMLAARENQGELVRWLVEHTSARLRRDADWSFRSHPDYYFPKSVLNEMIHHHQVSIVKFLLARNISLFRENELVDLLMVPAWDPYEIIQLLEPYRDHLKSFSSIYQVTSYISARLGRFDTQSLSSFILQYVRNVPCLKFLQELNLVRVSLRSMSRLTDRMTRHACRADLIEAYLEGKNYTHLIPNEEPELTILLPTLRPADQAMWNYHLRRTGWEKKLLDAKWIRWETEEE